MDKLRAYGNAIVPQVGAAFLKAVANLDWKEDSMDKKSKKSKNRKKLKLEIPGMKVELDLEALQKPADDPLRDLWPKRYRRKPNHPPMKTPKDTKLG